MGRRKLGRIRIWELRDGGWIVDCAWWKAAGVAKAHKRVSDRKEVVPAKRSIDTASHRLSLLGLLVDGGEPSGWTIHLTVTIGCWLYSTRPVVDPVAPGQSPNILFSSPTPIRLFYFRQVSNIAKTNQFLDLWFSQLVKYWKYIEIKFFKHFINILFNFVCEYKSGFYFLLEKISGW